MNKTAINNIISLLFSLIIFCLPVCNAAGVELTSEIRDTGTFRLRLIFSQDNTQENKNDPFSESRGFFAFTSGSDDENSLVFGISAPVILFGPVLRCGLFREIDNPVGYSPGSSIFDEESGLKLNTSFEPGPDRFIAYSVIPGTIMLFMRMCNEKPFYAGGLFRFVCAELFTFEFLYTCTGDAEMNNTDEWFYDRLPAAPGMVHHLSVKGFYKTKKLLVSAVCGLSGGELIMPGYFIRGFFSLDYGLLTPSLLFGYCSADYVASDGEYENKAIRTGARLLFEPVSCIDINAVYYFDLDHKPLFPAAFLPAAHTITSATDAVFGIGRKLDIVFGLDQSSSLAFDETGSKTEKHSIGLSSGIEGEWFSLESCFKLTLENADTPVFSAGIDVSLGTGCHSFSSQQNIFFNDDTMAYRGNIDYSIKNNGFNVWCSLSMKKPLSLAPEDVEEFYLRPFEYLSITLGIRVNS